MYYVQVLPSGADESLLGLFSRASTVNFKVNVPMPSPEQIEFEAQFLTPYPFVFSKPLITKTVHLLERGTGWPGVMGTNKKKKNLMAR
ncbi:hypothetical protein CEXT_407981 [Caerostris extrusa]|uniref:Uncharacterized protein n=1 Tax=Caerostris extrusa TaxID=172846 RepID=A0AAV4PQ03_CAEEX|nr:hypothetical protein CEXT_407981 [Caerostris extrusa]